MLILQRVDNYRGSKENQKVINAMQLEVESSETDNTDRKKIGFIDFVCNLEDESVSEMLSMRVIPSFIHSMRHHVVTDFTENSLSLWLVDMLLDGHKKSTIRRYLGALHTLYKQYKETEDAKEPDVDFSIPFGDYYSDATPTRLKDIDKNLKATNNLSKASVKEKSAGYLYIKAFQYLLYNPLANLNDVVNLKYGDDMPDNLHIEDIVTSVRKTPQSQYVFALQQGKRREPAIIKDLLSELHKTADRAGMIFGNSFSRDSITEIWIAAAVKAGIPYRDIVGMLKRLPSVYSFLSLIPANTNITDQKKQEILSIVADTIANKTPGWFVLRLRSGVKPKDIKDRLSDKESPLQRMISYYCPMRTVKRMVNKKMKNKEMPIIPGILFFRLPYDRINPLISIIGDLAWCYRTSANPSSPYSVIPQKEMKMFQKSVGSFTSDIEVDIMSSLPPLSVGDEVVIENGSMLDGQQAIIRKVRSIDGNVTYTLRLSDTAFIRWKEVTLPAANITKL